MQGLRVQRLGSSRSVSTFLGGLEITNSVSLWVPDFRILGFIGVGGDELNLRRPNKAGGFGRSTVGEARIAARVGGA